MDTLLHSPHKKILHGELLGFTVADLKACLEVIVRDNERRYVGLNRELLTP